MVYSLPFCNCPRLPHPLNPTWCTTSYSTASFSLHCLSRIFAWAFITSMSSPTTRLGISSGGPSRSVLQKLLEEIDNDDTPPALTRVGSLSYGPSRAGSLDLPRHEAPSIWVGGNSDAEDARRKLRALDEARQRRRSSVAHSSVPMSAKPDDEHTSTPSLVEASTPVSTTQANTNTSRHAFTDVEFGRAGIRSTIEEPSPTSESPEILTRRTTFLYLLCLSSVIDYHHAENKRERGWSNSNSPEMVVKRLRMGSPHRNPAARHHNLSDGGDTIMRGGGPIVISSSHLQRSSFTERRTHSRSGAFAEQSIIHRVSSFRRLDDAPRSPKLPSTPRRTVSRMDGSDSSATTPAWMKPFHLVDDDKSIYLNVHGEDWRDHALCLQCFRCHGSFHRILSTGCEVCGQVDILKGHYWELPDRE